MTQPLINATSIQRRTAEQCFGGGAPGPGFYKSLEFPECFRFSSLWFFASFQIAKTKPSSSWPGEPFNPPLKHLFDIPISKKLLLEFEFENDWIESKPETKSKSSAMKESTKIYIQSVYYTHRKFNINSVKSLTIFEVWFFSRLIRWF